MASYDPIPRNSISSGENFSTKSKAGDPGSRLMDQEASLEESYCDEYPVGKPRSSWVTLSKAWYLHLAVISFYTLILLATLHKITASTSKSLPRFLIQCIWNLAESVSSQLIRPSTSQCCHRNREKDFRRIDCRERRKPLLWATN